MNVNYLTRNVLLSEQMREDLADYVARIIKEKGLTNQDVADRSQQRISRGYVSQIISRTSRNLTVDKLAALADGLGEPLRKILDAAAGGSPADDDEYRQSVLFYLYEKTRRVPRADQDFIDGVIRMLLDRLEQRDHPQTG
jgi:transcriptional regulator with XRE-family HTH domain